MRRLGRGGPGRPAPRGLVVNDATGRAGPGSAGATPGATVAQGSPLLAGAATAPLLRLAAPISFWGGVDPETGSVCDPRHPDYGTSLAGRVVWIPSTIGSSSSSSVLAELIRLGLAPAALLIGRRDPILSLGAVVADEMGYGSVPVVELSGGVPATIADGAEVSVTEDGRVIHD